MATDFVKDVSSAKKTALAGYEALWNARLKILVAAGDLNGLLQHIGSPAEVLGDNCSCNSGCGALSAGDFSVDPAGLRRS